jgi:hypothetical protein
VTYRERAKDLLSRIKTLETACAELSSCLSVIDYACGEPNEMCVSEYDVHADPHTVVFRVCQILGAAHEVVQSVPADHSPADPLVMKHARALNKLSTLLSVQGSQ